MPRIMMFNVENIEYEIYLNGAYPDNVKCKTCIPRTMTFHACGHLTNAENLNLVSSSSGVIKAHKYKEHIHVPKC